MLYDCLNSVIRSIYKIPDQRYNIFPVLYEYLFFVIFNNLAKLVTPDHQILNLLKQHRR